MPGQGVLGFSARHNMRITQRLFSNNCDEVLRPAKY